jgi:hypothetical protein
MRTIKACGGSRGIAPFVLNRGTRCRSMVSRPPWLPYPRERPLTIHRIEGWMDVAGEEKTVHLLEIESRVAQ